MDCTSYRQTISAWIDGEEGALETKAVDRHLECCSSCRSWAEEATRVTRWARVGLAERVPDLTGPILASLRRAPATRARPQPYRGGRRPGAASTGVAARLGLFMVAIAQLLAAVPGLLGHDGGAPVNVAHEQGAWALALAVAWLVVVVRPARASALLPFVGALAVGLALTVSVDIAAGRTQAAAAAPQCLAVLGLGMLWVLSHDARWAPASPRRLGTPPSAEGSKAGVAKAA